MTTYKTMFCDIRANLQLRIKNFTDMILYFLTVLVAVASAKNSYIILVPPDVRPGMDVNIGVNILKANGNVQVTAKLSGDQPIASATESFKQGETKLVTLKIPESISCTGSYTLQVTGSGGLSFQNSTDLSCNSKSISIFVQTDKAMYIPGQKVLFRVFAVHPDLKMYTGPLTVTVLDPRGNTIKEMLNVKEASGIIQDQIELSDEPIMGNWTIKVNAGLISYEKTFTTAKYSLPKFEIVVELPPYILTSDKEVTATVKARYTYGKSVKGHFNVTGTLDNSDFAWNYMSKEVIVTKTGEIDGQVKIIIPLDHIKTLGNVGDRKITVTAFVTEDLTGITLNRTSSVTVKTTSPVTKNIKLEFLPTPTSFKPGIPYTAYFQILDHDHPISHSNKKLYIKTHVTWLASPAINGKIMYFNAIHTYDLPERQMSVPDGGLIPIHVNIPTNATEINLEVVFNGISNTLTLYKSKSPSNSYIELSVISHQVSAGSDVEFQVKSTQPVSSLVYQVLSRGSLVAAGSINGNYKKQLPFHIRTTPKMALDARIIVYYVTAGGEIVTDTADFDVEGPFENKVSITADKTSAQAGETINLEITAEPDSLVNILAVDQSVLLLKSGNDITQSQVQQEMKNYKTRSLDTQFTTTVYNDEKGSDAKKVFQKAGLYIMTDAVVFQYVTPYMHSPLLFPNPGLISVYQMVNREVQYVRSHFPETWIWISRRVGMDGRLVLNVTVPDTITSWITSAFAVSSTKGLGVSPKKTNIKVFRPFFVSLNLPYSVTRGEHVVLQAIVFNYLAQDVDVVVSMPQSSDYLNIIINANGQESTESKDQMETVLVKSNEAKNVFFPIIPSKPGKIDIKVYARCKIATDAVVRQLLVEPEGVPKVYNQPVVLNLDQSFMFAKTVHLSLPQNVVPGSERAVVTAIGDLMSPTVNGLDNLLSMPTGCGEQTMLGLAPDVFVTNYLKTTNHTSTLNRAREYMKKGYQRELTFQHYDNSFSAFGNQDNSGSMWLTAFVVKTFHQAKPHIYIDDKVLVNAITWMINYQKADGSFPEPGRIIHKNLQGGSGSGPALTAFVLISLLENNNLSGADISKAKLRAVEYLHNQLPNIKDVYTLAITAYALKLAQSHYFQTVFNRLQSMATFKDNFKFWQQGDVGQNTNQNYWKPPHQPKAVDIEITSYVLLTYAEMKDFDGGLSTMKWVLSQRNPSGGFSSTQDTVVALQALTQFSSLKKAKDFDIQVHLTAGSFFHHFSISQENAHVLQHVELPSVPNNVQVAAIGHVIAAHVVVDVAVYYHVDAQVEAPSFEVTVRLSEETIKKMRVKTCVRWLHTGASGMAVQEIGLPSGFEADVDSIGRVPLLKRTETANKKVILYFDEIGNKPTCLTVTLQRTGLIAKTQPASVRVYDYYEPSNQATAFYQSQILKDSDICSVCSECNLCKRH